MNPTQTAFYVTGGTLGSDARCYVERQADRDIYLGLKEGEFCYVLTPRQMGKSSLMVRTAERLRQDGTAVAVLDLTAIGQNLNAEQWYDGLIGHIARQFNLDDELEDFWLGNERLGPLQRFMRAIREVVLPRCQGQVVIFVDEIDAVRSLPFSTDEFFAAIRECYNRRTEDAEFARLTYCLLGVASPSDLIRDTRTTPFNIGRRIELRDFTASEAAALATGLRRDEGPAAVLLGRILHWTGGHPYLTQRMCRVVADNPGVSRQADVDRICADLFLSNRARERDDNLLFVRERLLRSEVDLAGLLDLYGRLLRRPLIDDETNPLISVLRLSGISRVVKETLQVRNRIYQRVFDRRWVESNMPDAEKRRQRRAYRRGMLRASAAMGVIVVIVSILGLIAWRRTQEANRANEDLQEKLYTNNIAVAERELTNNHDIGLASELLEACPEKLRGWEWWYLMRLRDGDRLPLGSTIAISGQPPIPGTEGGHKSGIWMAAFSPDGQRAATCSIDGTVKIWDTDSGKMLRTYTGHGGAFRLIPGIPDIPVMCFAFSPDGRHIASGSFDPKIDKLRESRGVVKIWEVETGREILTFEQTGAVLSIAFSPDGKRIASSGANDDNSFVVWDAKTKEVIRVIRGHNDLVQRLRYSPDGRFLISGCQEGRVKLWDAATLEEVLSLEAHPGPVKDLAFSPDGARFASAGFDGTVRVWDLATGTRLLTLKGHTGSALGVTFSPDGTRIASAGFDKTVRLWDAANGNPRLTLRGHTSLVWSVAFTPDGQRLLSGSFDSSARIWDATPRQEVSSSGLFTISQLNDRVNTISLSRDGRYFASGGWDHRVYIWDAETGAAVRSLEGHKAVVWGVAFSPDGKRLASGSWDKTVKIWDVETGSELRSFTGHKALVHCVDFSPNGKHVVSGSLDAFVKIWDAQTGEVIVTREGGLFPISSVAFSPDGKRVASGSTDRSVTVWDAATGKDLFTLNGHGGAVPNLAFSPDGNRLVSASWDSTLKMWDVNPNRRTLFLQSRELFALKGHRDQVNSVAFSGDGKWIVSGGEDKTVRLWDAATGKEVQQPRYQRGVVWATAFAKDGKRLIVGSWYPFGCLKTLSLEK